MSILISKDNKNALRIDESSFKDEDKMQKYIFTNPESLPIDDIKDESRLLIVSREFSTNSGPIDALGLDKDGDIYIIETKLEKNTDKRRVIAQVLDYGAALFFHSSNFQDFLTVVDNEINKNFKTTFRNKIIDFFGFNEDEYNQFYQNVETNLNSGNYKFIVLMDKLESRLKDIIKYVNQNSNFDLYGVEMLYYEFENYQIIIPKLFGAEVTKNLKIANNKAKKTWNEKTFFEQAEIEMNDDEFSQNQNCEISWGKGLTGSFSARFVITGGKALYYVSKKYGIWFDIKNIENNKIKTKFINILTTNGIDVKSESFGIKLTELTFEQVQSIFIETEPLFE